MTTFFGFDIEICKLWVIKKRDWATPSHGTGTYGYYKHFVFCSNIEKCKHIYRGRILDFGWDLCVMCAWFVCYLFVILLWFFLYLSLFVCWWVIFWQFKWSKSVPRGHFDHGSSKQMAKHVEWWSKLLLKWSSIHSEAPANCIGNSHRSLEYTKP